MHVCIVIQRKCDNYHYLIGIAKSWQALVLLLGFDAIKPVFGFSQKARLKPLSLATKTNYKTEIQPYQV